MIIVDNIGANFQLHPDNGIEIRSWLGDNLDTILSDLQIVLIDIALSMKK